MSVTSAAAAHWQAAEGTPISPPVLSAHPSRWPLDRAPLPLETSWPGVFAVGDVRYRSIKRVASAVGDGATAVRLVHEYLEAEAADALEHGYSLPFLGKPVAGSLTWDQET
jgi:NADPH-dependent glutamate synthase beta subunit-like oxidoreductase